MTLIQSWLFCLDMPLGQPRNMLFPGAAGFDTTLGDPSNDTADPVPCPSDIEERRCTSIVGLSRTSADKGKPNFCYQIITPEPRTLEGSVL
jgi:hypothetical protein